MVLYHINLPEKSGHFDNLYTFCWFQGVNNTQVPMYMLLVSLIHTDSMLTFETLLHKYLSDTTVLGLDWLVLFSLYSAYELEIKYTVSACCEYFF